MCLKNVLKKFCNDSGNECSTGKYSVLCGYSFKKTCYANGQHKTELLFVKKAYVSKG